MTSAASGTPIAHPVAGSALLLRRIPGARTHLGRCLRILIPGVQACHGVLLLQDPSGTLEGCLGFSHWRADAGGWIEAHAAALPARRAPRRVVRALAAWLIRVPFLAGGSGTVVDLPSWRTDLIAMCHRLGFRCFRTETRDTTRWILASRPVEPDADLVEKIDRRGGRGCRLPKRCPSRRAISGPRPPTPEPRLTARLIPMVKESAAAREWLRLGRNQTLASTSAFRSLHRASRIWSAPEHAAPWVVLERLASSRPDALILVDSAVILRSAASLACLRSLCKARGHRWGKAMVSPPADPALLAALGMRSTGFSIDRSASFIESDP